MENSSGGTPTVSELTALASSHGMTTVPNLADGANVWVDYEKDYGIPSIAYIGPDMTVLGVDTYDSNPAGWLP